MFDPLLMHPLWTIGVSAISFAPSLAPIQVFQESLHSLVLLCNDLLISLCQLLALLVIAIGVIQALMIYVHNALIRRQISEAFQQGRLRLGYSFSLGLSFLVGATILKTMTSSEWSDIARLGIVIGLRTTLNLLLERAIRVGSQAAIPSHSTPTPAPTSASIPAPDLEAALVSKAVV